MKKRVMALAVIALGLMFTCSHVVAANNYVKSDEYIRNRVLLLKSKHGSCSAIEFKSPAGKVYTLSAAHCSVLAENEYINAITEQGDQKLLKVLRIDEDKDLMLLEAFDNKSIEIAKTDSLHEKVHTLTHGRGMPTYRTDGELLSIMDVLVGKDMPEDSDTSKCLKVELSFDGLTCVVKQNVRQSTAKTLPGSSGGAVLNEKGQLIGIVSCGDDEFSGFVKLSDINEFVKSI